MASQLTAIENKLNDIFGKSAPKLPEGGKKFFVAWLPIGSLIVGALSLWAAWTLWHWASAADSLSDYANNLCNTFGAGDCVDSRFSVWVWLSLALMAVQGVIYLMAYTGLKAHKKAGWNLLFYGALLNLVYAVVSLFNDYRGGSSFIGGLIGSAIAFYVLFQIRSAYSGGKAAPATPAH